MAPFVDGPPADDPIIEALNQIARDSEDRIWRTNAMAQLTVRMGEGGFRKSSLAAGDPELFFKGVRAGKRAKFIFEFEPVDARPFVAVEIDETKVFEILNGFEQLLVDGLGYGQGLMGGPIPFSKAAGIYRKDAAIKAKELAEAAGVAAAQTDASRYAKNPLWGAF